MLKLYWNTVSHLKPIQLRHRLFRRTPRPSYPAAPGCRLPSGPWVEPTWNQPIALTRPCPLQQYTLHYHDRPTGELIRAWIAANPPGEGVAWDPYPLSRRITNWIKWLLDGNAASPEICQSLAAQAHWLSRRVEYHLLANHIFENAKALAFAGCFFESTDWLRKGRRLLEHEIPEQILPDGAHFERSPMYHSLILEDLLDLVNLGRAYPGLLPDYSPETARMLGWLQRMTHPDGRISFFNDAAFGVAPEPRHLLDYAARLDIRPAMEPLQSGYIRLENSSAVVLFDAAPVGPDYQPGHAHADTLSFELSVAGSRAIVNSGVSTYDNCSQRRAQRGTAAHNTVRVDGQDSTEVWAAFRTARRARPFDIRTDHQTFAEASHNGYQRLKDPVIHTRRLDLSEGELRITDTLSAKRCHQAELFFHFHPESRIRIHLDPALVRSEETTNWFPQFEIAIPNRTVVGRWTGQCPVTFTTRIPLTSPSTSTSPA